MRTFLRRPKLARVLLLTVFSGLLSFSLKAQVSISGKVTGKNGEALPGISVVVRNQGVGTTTDGSGNYAFTADLPAGSYVIDFSGTGYKGSSATVNVASGVAAYKADARLETDAL